MRYEDMDELALSDPTLIPNPDADKHYVWVNALSPQRMLYYMRKGFAPVVGAEQCKRLFGDGSEIMLDANGRIRSGDGVLFACTLEVRDKIRRLKELKRRRLMDAPFESFRADADNLGRGVKAVIETPEEHADRKEFDTREGRPRVTVPSMPKRSA